MNNPSNDPSTAITPEQACDCHVHVFLDPAQFPFATPRAYTPPPAGVEELVALHAALGVGQTVIVQPSVYGADNSATLEGIRLLGPERARGVAVIDESIIDPALARMHQAGIRGIRANLALAGEEDPERARRLLRGLADRVRPHGWHIQIYTGLKMIAALRDCLSDLPVPVVIDHFGGARGEGGTEQAGFADLVSLVRSGQAYVKLSAPYRSSERVPGYPDMAPLAQALIAANPDRMLWGSDWPHPDASRTAGRQPGNISPRLPVNDQDVFDLLRIWAGDAVKLRKILVDNPAILYGF